MQKCDRHQIFPLSHLPRQSPGPDAAIPVDGVTPRAYALLQAGLDHIGVVKDHACVYRRQYRYKYCIQRMPLLKSVSHHHR